MRWDVHGYRTSKYWIRIRNIERRPSPKIHLAWSSILRPGDHQILGIKWDYLNFIIFLIKQVSNRPTQSLRIKIKSQIKHHLLDDRFIDIRIGAGVDGVPDRIGTHESQQEAESIKLMQNHHLDM